MSVNNQAVDAKNLVDEWLVFSGGMRQHVCVRWG
jgi:hypothetical protein